MFVELFRKESVQILKSITFYIMLAAIVFFFTTQNGEFETFSKPVEGQEKSYGLKACTDKQKIMDVTLAMLAREYDVNSYVSYPIGFYKMASLKESEQQEIHDILSECTGLKDNFTEAVVQGTPTEVGSEDGEMFQMEGKVNPPMLAAKEDLTYDRFLRLMKKADEIIGGGTDYAPNKVKNNVSDKATYEDALKIYEDSLYTDKISRGKARLFCDYMGIMLGIMPAFLAVTRVIRDRRSGVSALIYSRPVSSWKIVTARFGAALLAVMAPVAILAVMPTLQCIYYGHTLGVSVDVLAYGKYILGWLLPEAAFVLALGFLLTELTGGPVAILLQGIFWFVSIFLNMGSLVGNVGWGLVPRFNNDQSTDIWIEVFPQMVQNRLLYAVLSIVLLGITVWIYHLKRKGVFGHGRASRSHRKGIR